MVRKQKETKAIEIEKWKKEKSLCTRMRKKWKRMHMQVLVLVWPDTANANKQTARKVREIHKQNKKQSIHYDWVGVGHMNYALVVEIVDRHVRPFDFIRIFLIGNMYAINYYRLKHPDAK